MCHNWALVSLVSLAISGFALSNGANVVDIDLSTVVNIVDDDFISLVIDPRQLLDMREEPQKLLNQLANHFQPTQFRIDGGDEANEWIRSTPALVSMARWLRTAHLKPTITVPLNFSTKLRELMPILGALRSANITHCTLQLGSVLPNHTDSVAYADDLLTLWHIQNALGDSTWSVMAADLPATASPQTAQLYAELTEPLTAATNYRLASTMRVADVHVAATRHPALLHPERLATDGQRNHSVQLAEGLRWARTLGGAAQFGFAGVLQPIADLGGRPQFGHLVSVLHKLLLGTRVLYAQQHPEPAADSQENLFVHCSRSGANGSFAVMGVNLGAGPVRMTTKLSASLTGLLVRQYVLSEGANNTLLLNDLPVESLTGPFEPISKIRKRHRPISFAMPGQSVAFWVFPEAQLEACGLSETLAVADSTDSPTAMPPQSPTEQLLHQLIRESVGIAEATNSPVDNALNRRKRQIAPGMHKLFGKFERNSANKFQLFKKRQQPVANGKVGSVGIPAVASVYDVYQADESQTLFKSSENIDLPKGDVFMEVGNDQQSADYVAFDEPADKLSAKSQPDVLDVPDDIDLMRYPNQFLEFDEAQVVRGGRDQGRDEQDLWDQRGGGGNTYDAAVIRSAEDQQRMNDGGSTIPKIVRAREPTWQENQDNLRKAKSTLDGIYYDGSNSPNAFGFDRPKKMTTTEDTFFQTRRRRRRAISKTDEENHVEPAATDKEIVADKVPLSPYQERLLNKMLRIMNELQRLIGTEGNSNSEESASSSKGMARMHNLADELRDIEAYLMRNRRRPASVGGGGFFGKSPANGDSNGFFGKSQTPAAIADDIPRRCKALASSLEQQCLREIGATSAKTSPPAARSRRFPRSLPTEMQQPHELDFWWWDDGRPQPAVVQPAERQWAADDPRHNMIYKHGEEPQELAPLVAFYMRQPGEPVAVAVHTELPPQFVGKQEEEMVLPPPPPPPSQPAQSLSTEEGNGSEKHPPPRFMKTLTRSMEGLLDVVNEHVAGWWHMMS